MIHKPKHYSAQIVGGEALTPAPVKLSAEQSPSERIEEGERFVVIPAQEGEKLVVQLSGSGGKGTLILVTTDAVTQYAYPTTSWESMMEIDCAGKTTVIQGEVLKSAP
jgi:hypothetical protein